MDSNLTDGSVPLGFGMALAQNIKALDQFATLTDEEKKLIIGGARGVDSKAEMRQYVNNLIDIGKD